MDALIRRSFVVLVLLLAVSAAGACGGGQMSSGTAGTGITGTAGTTGGTGAVGGCGGQPGTRTCANLGVQCGTVYDCGYIYECGTCSPDYACGINGKFGKCETPGKWTVVLPATDLFDMRAVWGSAANDVWAVSSYGDVWHYDGAQWELATSVANPLYAVNGSNASTVFFAGANGMVLKLGATALTQLPRYGNDYTGLWVTGPNLVWAADDLYIDFWDGAKWDSSGNNTGEHYALWGLPDGQVWGANGDGSIVHVRAGTTVQEVQRQAGTSDYYQAIWGVDANNIWAVGSQISRWTGTEWMDLGYSNFLYGYRGVWASSPTNVWVVGNDGFIAHGNGYEFTQVPSPTSYSLNAIWGSGPNDIWAVGERGLIIHYGP
jgi:hypothetical protein